MRGDTAWENKEVSPETDIKQIIYSHLRNCGMRHYESVTSRWFQQQSYHGVEIQNNVSSTNLRSIILDSEPGSAGCQNEIDEIWAISPVTDGSLDVEHLIRHDLDDWGLPDT